MADDPVSWFFLTVIGIYFICRFFKKVINESKRLKAEREKACQEIFFENPLDKTNAMAYNRFNNRRKNK